ncbi:CGNR zinc finger domain-containing protein [Mycolicibacterium grossiae]|uniref:Zinc finger CGNR domain-containing protein n=1 Tax=Mycolicibacterium grossiae TaxID=1552759 RepID=A0A1E8PWR8_9MYCO|nr:CGNR zinc finger domain-containing protein [Mycolicibacterium grossiae]OFJ50300.1 hypothetical protein BEL07_29225 [Mycolicibacterium grossiae]QEM45373.1 CGNR zinc finger domain-containing protein [Mycolicibacterium grossiae]
MTAGIPDDVDVLVALLNTTPVVDGRATETLDGAWLRAHGGAELGVGAARRLRDALQQVVRGEAVPTSLGDYLDGVVQRPALSSDGVQWRLDAGWAAHMVLAWGELAATQPGRLRPCANDECHLFLLDRSRAGTARWCSMEVCGNRMKARRHYGRTASRT